MALTLAQFCTVQIVGYLDVGLNLLKGPASKQLELDTLSPTLTSSTLSILE